MSDKSPTDLERAGERVYVLSPLAENSPPEDRGVPLADLVSGVWRRRRVIAAVTLVGGLLGFGFAQLGPERYEATSTLLIQPPQFASDLKPAALSVEAYETLLRADYTLSRVREELTESNVLEQGVTIPALRKMISTQIPQAEGQRLPFNLPMIAVTARTSDAEKSEQIANTVARVFAQSSRDLATQGQEGSLQLIESHYPATLKRLEQAVEGESERRDHYAREFRALTRRWEKTMNAYNVETRRLTADYERETQRMTLEFERLRQPEMVKAQLELKKKRLVAMEEELEDIRMELKTSEYALTEVERLLEDQPEKIKLEQAFVPWWMENPPGTPEGRPDPIAVESETPNATRRNLMDKFVERRVEVETLRPRASDLESEIARVREQVAALGLKVMELKLDERDLEEKRREGLAELKRKRSEGLNDLTSARDLEIGEFERNRDMELASLNREANHAEATFELIAERYESARLAKSEREPDVKIGALALRPESPVSRATPLKTAIGLAAAFVLAFFAAVIAEALSAPPRPQREEPALTRAQLDGHRERRLAEG